RRGVVTSASYEARAYGVQSARPMARAVRLCPGATVVPVPWEACADKGREIGAVLRRFTPAVEQASSDEFYLDLSGTERLYGNEPLAATALRIRAAVLMETTLSLSIGGGTSKFVAKLAAGVAKPRPGAPSDGVHVVPPGAEPEFMLRFALADLRDGGLAARTVTVKLRDADFITRQASRTLPDPVQSDRAVYAVARQLLARLREARRVPARLLGVALSHLGVVDAAGQLSLLERESGGIETERDRTISRVID